MNFSSIIGHTESVGMLRKMAEGGRLPHALLFSGHEGIGKRLCACVLSAEMNCASPESGGACGSCASCRQLASGNHPLINFVGSPKNEPELRVCVPGGDIIINNIIPHAENGRKVTVKINVEQTREVVRLASLKVRGGGKKIFIIDDPADTSLVALNALLKVLEEPPESTYFILVTNREVTLLQTIVSRCQRVEFLPLKPGDIQQFIDKRVPEADDLPDAVSVSGGSPGRLMRYVKASQVAFGKVSPEIFFQAVSKWHSGGDCLEKLAMLLELEAAKFRETLSDEAYSRVLAVESALADLKKNANTDLTVSNMFLKLGAVDL